MAICTTKQKKSEEQKCVYIGFMDSSTPGILEGNYMCQVLPGLWPFWGRLKIRDLHENRVIKLGHCQMVPKLGSVDLKIGKVFMSF